MAHHARRHTTYSAPQHGMQQPSFVTTPRIHKTVVEPQMEHHRGYGAVAEHARHFDEMGVVNSIDERVKKLEKRSYKAQKCDCDAALEQITKQVEQLQNDQSKLCSETFDQALKTVERQHVQVIEEVITKVNNSLSILHNNILKEVASSHQQLAKDLIKMLEVEQKRLNNLEQKLSLQDERLAALESSVLSAIENVDSNTKQSATMLSNLHQDSAQRIEKKIDVLQSELTNFLRMVVPERGRQGGATPDKPSNTGGSNMLTRFLWGSSPGRDQGERARSEQWVVYQSQTESLRASNAELQRQFFSISEQLQATQQTLEKVENEKETLMQVVMKVKGDIGGTWAGGRTPADVVSDYEKLFTKARSSLKRALKQSTPHETNVLANKIFEVAYEECHTAVLQELFRELFLHHGPDQDMEVAETQMRLYGQLLGLKHRELSSKFDDQQLTLKVLKRVFTCYETEAVNPHTDPRYLFTQKAITTALDMITMQPPMVIEYPCKFVSESIQDKMPGEWDESLMEGDYKIEYFRPVLYPNFREQDPSKAALVGNKRQD